MLFDQIQAPKEYLGNALTNDLVGITESLILVFDDFHFIESEPVQLVSRLVERLPEELQVVIVTQENPDLPLAQWRVRKWLAEIGADELRFLPEEALEYFASYLKRQLTADSIRQLVARSEGWVAGLQLASLSMMSARDPDVLASSFSGNERAAADYLVDELISGQASDVKKSLA